MTKNHKESAVSPVVGVMLMLVVTIIIAAVVSAFAGSTAQTTKQAPQAVIQGTLYVNGSSPNNLIVLTHKGGDELATAKVQILIKKGDEFTMWGSQLSSGSNVLNKSLIYNSAGTYWMNSTNGGTDINVWRSGEVMYYATSGYSSSDVGKSLILEVDTSEGKLISTSKMPIVT